LLRQPDVLQLRRAAHRGVRGDDLRRIADQVRAGATADTARRRRGKVGGATSSTSTKAGANVTDVSCPRAANATAL
jgi:hypothetical protein